MASVTWTCRPVIRTGTLTLATCMARFSFGSLVVECPPPGEPAPGFSLKLHLESLPQIHPPGDWVVDEEIFGPLRHHLALIDEVGSIDDGQCLTDVVVGDQNR